MAGLKGVILCAGEGRRLRPFTYACSKALLPLANRHLIDYVLEALRDAGVTDTCIVISPSNADIPRALGDGRQRGLTLTYATQLVPRGLADAAMQARDAVGDSPFVLYLGDTIAQYGVAQLVRSFLAGETEAAVMLGEVAEPQHYGVAELDGDLIRRLVEKPQRPRSNLAVVAAYCLRPSIWSAIERIQPSPRGELEMTDAIQRLIDDGHAVLGVATSGWWVDAGTPEKALAANARLLSEQAPLVQGAVESGCSVVGDVQVGPGAEVSASALIGPCAVGADCRITECEIGPDVSVGAGTRVRGARVRNSILGASVVVEGPVGLEGCILGDRVVLSAPAGAVTLAGACLCADTQIHLRAAGTSG